MVERASVPATIAGAEAPKVETPAASTPAPASNERPAWLPEKFKDAAQMATAYAELEKKLSGAPADAAPEKKPDGEQPAEQKTPDQQEAKEALKVAGVELAEFTTEFEKDGKLSDASYAKLEEKGFPRAVVDTYINSVQASNEVVTAKATAQIAEVQNAVGGEQKYGELVKWAASSLPPAEQEAYNAVVQTGDVAKIKLAVEGLNARYVAAEGKEPTLVGGAPPGQSRDVFRSTSEIDLAMRDPRYGKDRAYTQDVEQKALRSSVYR